MRTIDSYAIQFGTDKSSEQHDFAAFYETLFGHLRDKPCRMIEFGVKTGASIRMWEEAFPSATIVGVDKTLRVMSHRPVRAKLVVADLSDKANIKSICDQYGPFDFAIDDSAHTNVIAQNIVDVVFVDYIKPGGWLVIEDVNSGYKRNLRPDQVHDFIGWSAEMVKAVNHHGNLCKCGPAFFDRSSEFDKAIRQLVYVPGIMAMQRR